MKDRAKILAVAVVLTVIIAVAVWQNKSTQLMTAATGTLSWQLQQAIGSNVQVERLALSGANAVTLHQVAIYDDANQLLVAADQVTVTVGLWRILQGQAGIAAVDAVTVLHPVVVLKQGADGRWNIESLLRSSDDSSKDDFDAKLTIVDGSASIATSADGDWQLAQINGTMSISAGMATAMKLSVAHQNSTLAVRGFWGVQRGAINITADQLMLADYRALVPPGNAFALVGGRVTAAEAIFTMRDGQFDYAGEVKVHDGAVDVAGVPVRDIAGPITFTRNQVALFTTASVFQQPLKLHGKVNIGGKQPVLGLTVSSPAFDTAVLNMGLPVKGVAAFEAAVNGIADQLVVSAHLSAQQAVLADYAVSGLRARLHYAGDVLQLEDVQATVWDGQIGVQGQISLQERAFHLQVNAQGIDSTAAMIDGLSGRINAVAAINGAGSLDGAAVHGQVIMPAGGQYSGINFGSLNSNFYKNGDDLIVDYINIGLGEGMMTAAGSMQHGQLKFTVGGNKLPLAAVAGLFPQLSLSGTAGFSGHIGGSLQAPQLQAAFTAVDGQAFEQPFAEAQGQLALTADRIVLNDVILTDGPASHKINGWLGLHGSQPVSLEIVTRQARAEHLVKLLLPGEQLTGNVDNQITVSGSLDQITAQGSIRLSEGSFRGFLIAGGSGDYSIENGRTTIRDFVIDSLNTQVKFGGVIQADHQLDLDIVAQQVDIAKLHVRSPYPIAGQASFIGRLRGTPSAPAFTGSLMADRLSFNVQELEQIAGIIEVAGDQVDVASFGFKQGRGNFTFAGGLNLSSHEIYGNLAVTSGQLASLLAILNMPLDGIDGELNGNIRISGNTDKPDIALTGDLKNGRIKKYPLDHIAMHVVLHDRVVTVHEFRAQQGQGVLAARGTAELGGRLDLEVGGNEIDAGLISNWLDSDIETTGKLNFTAQIAGTVASPTANLSLEIANGGVAGATFDSLYGLLALEQGVININQLMIAKDVYRASAYGVIPLAALTKRLEVQGADGRMDVKVRLDEADLSILPMLTKEVSWAAGRTQGELAIGGTLKQPSLAGSIAVQNGIMKLAALGDPIQQVALDIQFDDDKINVTTFEGLMGGGSYHLGGWARLHGMTFDEYDFNLKLDKLRINNKYFKGPLNGTLAFVSGSRRPKLSGKLLFENVTIDIPFVPEMTTETPDIALDVEMTVGKKTRLYNSYLYDIWLDGRVHFGGTTRRPDASGKIVASRGTVSYLRTPFKIKEASAEFMQVRSFAPVIKLEAETRLDRTKVFLNINGPVGELDFGLTAQPAMSQQEILSLLTLRSRYFDKQDDGGAGLGREELLTLLDTGLQLRFVSELESAFRKTFGLDEFRLVRDTLKSNGKGGRGEDREVYNLEFGKYLTDRLMINYTLGIGYDDNNKIGFRYDLTNTMSIVGGYGKEDGEMIGIETRFKF